VSDDTLDSDGIKDKDEPVAVETLSYTDASRELDAIISVVEHPGPGRSAGAPPRCAGRRDDDGRRRR
jgi:hypothetical protein